MISGNQFPKQLMDNRDLEIYRTYLNAKAEEPKSSYLPTLVATVLGAGGGAYVGHKGVGRPVLGALAGAVIPAALGSALKSYDDHQIEKAKTLRSLDDDVLSAYLEAKIKRIQARPPQAKKVFDATDLLFGKTAKLNPIIKGGLYATGALAGIAGIGAIASQRKHPEKWRNRTPEEVQARKLKIPGSKISDLQTQS